MEYLSERFAGCGVTKRKKTDLRKNECTVAFNCTLRIQSSFELYVTKSVSSFEHMAIKPL